jgi:DNA adenine methylase
VIDPRVARPVVKWAGGKSRLAPRILAVLPPTWHRLLIPFAGGLGLFWRLADRLGPLRPILSDANGEIVTLYQVIRDRVGELIVALQDLEGDHGDAFDRLRDQDPDRLEPVAVAVRMVYLNRWGFNGLYRVNAAGVFNVPRGTGGRLLYRDNLEAAALALKDALIWRGDFAPSLAHARAGDLVYLDPPYDQSFAAYTARGFGEADQVRLAELVRRLGARGVRVIVSHADTPLIRRLYSGLEVLELVAPRSISRDGNRAPAAEVLIRNFGPAGGLWR